MNTVGLVVVIGSSRPTATTARNYLSRSQVTVHVHRFTGLVG